MSFYVSSWHAQGLSLQILKTDRIVHCEINRGLGHKADDSKALYLCLYYAQTEKVQFLRLFRWQLLITHGFELYGRP